ncbi:SubName: Full=Uncharacterized protein {ECO:0000313/EMBL:CCA76227.1} [Serendipita indica DSM 11827]|nr:SubName: Full=Uncharacterized protein {ECO:0000313/EMBL:CCA76227.1} [Serendipita indica DSM 11827]
MDIAQLFRTRLQRDLLEIQANADAGIHVHVASEDMRRLCLQLCPQNGPWAYLRLHFTVELPSNWVDLNRIIEFGVSGVSKRTLFRLLDVVLRAHSACAVIEVDTDDVAPHFLAQPASPPRIWSTINNIQHPNILDEGLVCCDLFRETAGGYSGTKYAGYTPGYRLRGVFQQLLAMFSSSWVSDNYGSRGEHLGSAVIEHYVTEADLMGPFRQSYSLNDRRSAYPYVESEQRLERLWNADDSEEVLIMAYETEDGSEIRQLTKKSMLRGQIVPQSSFASSTSHFATSEVQAISRASKMCASTGRVFKFESRSPFWERTRRKLEVFECTECGYGIDSMPHYSPGGILPLHKFRPPYMIPARVNQLSRLKMDTLHVLCDFLPDESLRALSVAYPPFDAFLRRANVLRRRQVRCFYLSTPFEDRKEGAGEPELSSTMGIGIALDAKTNRLSCPTLVDGFLSEAAFQKCGVRRSSRKHEFGFFLPLALNYRHLKQIKPRVFECLKTLSQQVALADPHRWKSNPAVHSPSLRSTRATTTIKPPALNIRTPLQADVDSVNVLYKLLNDVMTGYMRSCEAILDAPPAALRRRGGSGGSLQAQIEEEESATVTLTHAAERFLPVYWQVLHLLISLCRENPAILRAAHARVRQFIDHPEKRSKEYEPDLGELLVVAALVFACQDEGLLPLRDTGEVVPPQPTRQRESQRSQTTPGGRRYDLRNGHNARRPASVTSGSGRQISGSAKDSVIRWSEHFAGPLLKEAMTRGVKTALEHSPDLQHLETGACPYRTTKTFQHCRGPLRQLALQVSMVAVFNYFETMQKGPHPQQTHLDRNFGNPPPEAVLVLTEEVKAVHRLSTWGELFIKIQYENGKAWSDVELASALRQCMLLSERRGYHTNHYQHAEAKSRLLTIRAKGKGLEDGSRPTYEISVERFGLCSRRRPFYDTTSRLFYRLPPVSWKPSISTIPRLLIPSRFW